jgi:hypothetical protein
MTLTYVDPAARDLIAPLLGAIDQALAGLGSGIDLEVGIGDAPLFGTLTVDDRVRLTLSDGLLGEGVHHPAEQDQPLGLDRWRRALCGVLEAIALGRIVREAGRPIAVNDWRARGLALFLADRAAPSLGLAAPTLIQAARRGDVATEPREGVVVCEALVARGEDPERVVMGWLREDRWPDEPTFVAVARFALGSGIAGRISVPFEAAPAVDIPCDLPPWSFRRLAVPAHPRGGLVAVEGSAWVERPWAVGGQELRCLAVAREGGGRLTPQIAGPIGRWDCVSARGFGQVFGVRGMTWHFGADGRVELVLADAYAGSLDAVAAGEAVGTSGIVPGRWSIAGPHAVQVARLDTSSLALHGRGDQPFSVPAAGLGIGQVIAAMQEASWTFEVRDGDLYLRGPLMGGTVELRMRPSSG